MLEPPADAPPVRHACSETVNFVSRLMRPSLISRKTTSAVMIFTVEAGDVRSSAAFSKSTVCESASIRTTYGAVVENDSAASAAADVKAKSASGATKERRSESKAGPRSIERGHELSRTASKRQQYS